MAVSSEDGVDRESREYSRGYTEALDAVIQRLMNEAQRAPGTELRGINKALGMIQELLAAKAAQPVKGKHENATGRVSRR